MFRRKNHVSSSLGRIAWKKLLQDPLAVSGLTVIILAVMVALLGYLITPDQSPFCNRQYLELSARPPGFSVTILKVRKNEPERRGSIWHTMLHGKISPYNHIPVNRIRFENGRVMAEEFSDQPGDTLFLREFSLPDVVYAIDPVKPVRTEGERVSFTLLDGMHATASAEQVDAGDKDFPFCGIYFGIHLVADRYRDWSRRRLFQGLGRFIRTVADQCGMVCSHPADGHCHYPGTGKGVLADICCRGPDHVGRSSPGGTGAGTGHT